MKKLKIKNTNIEIAPINFGGNVFGWTLNEKESFEMLDNFTGEGFNFIDTADMYSYWVNNDGGGQSETIIGNWLSERKNRAKIIIATKGGGETAVHPKDVSKKHLIKSVEDSLKRLKTDYIDLYYTHFDDEKTPVEETMSAYDELVRVGKIRHIAASNVSPERLKASMEVAAANNFPKYVALQPHYNLLIRDNFEKNYAPLVQEYDWSVFTYWSLESGFLTGKYQSEEDFDKTTRGAGIKKHFDERGKSILQALNKVSAKHNAYPATVSLAWLLHNPLVTAPVVSATSKSQLAALVKAPTLELDQEDLALLNEL